ncbi:hypothetical protein LCGC14_0376680 [marine sediment metagenome]|uniref:Large polyvalent protein associated domain-containing protein n=1 Tax=marine sediment metagenome TaxID=412755 RepID=A0A0F9TLM4_9ZZZZ
MANRLTGLLDKPKVKVNRLEGLLDPVVPIVPDPARVEQGIKDTLDIAEKSNVPIPSATQSHKTFQDIILRQDTAWQRLLDMPRRINVPFTDPVVPVTPEDVIRAEKESAQRALEMQLGLAVTDPSVVGSIPAAPIHPLRTAEEIAKGGVRFGETVLGISGGTVPNWVGRFIEAGGRALDDFVKLGTVDKDQIYNPYAEAIMAFGRNMSRQGKADRKLWAERAQTGWEALDPQLKETDPVSYGAGRLTEGVASSALSVLAVYLSGGGAAPALLNQGFRINRGLVALSGLSAAGGFEHAQALEDPTKGETENFLWSTVQGFADGLIEYVMESSFLDDVGKGGKALTAGRKEATEEFFTGGMQTLRAKTLENDAKGMSAYDSIKDAVKTWLVGSPWDIAAGFIGGYGIQGGANLIALTKTANAIPLEVEEAPTAPAKPSEVAPPADAPINVYKTTDGTVTGLQETDVELRDGVLVDKDTGKPVILDTEASGSAIAAPAAEVTPEGEVPIQKPLAEEGAGGIAWQTAMKNVLALAEKDRPLIKKEQTEARSQRVGAMAGTLEFLRGKGVPGKEAIHRASGQLKGALTNYEGRYQPLEDIIEPAFIQAAENDIADTENLTPFDRISLTNHDKTGAWDKMLRGAAMTPGDVRLIRKWQPLLAKEASKRVPLSTKFWSGLESLLGTLKFGAGFDIQTRRQARWMRGRHPIIFRKAVGRNIAAYISNQYADKMAAETESSPNYKMEARFSSQKNGLKFLSRHPEVSVDRPEQFTATIPKELPFLGKRLKVVGKGAEVVYKYTGGQIGRVHAASMRGFIDSFNWMQQKLWDQQINNWKQNNIEITPKMLHDLVDFQNTMMGMAKPKTNFGQAVNRVMRPVMWSPSLTWSRVRTPSLMLSNSTMRTEVAATLGTYIGTGLMYLGAASMLARWWDLDDVVEWDVDSSDFGKIKLGNTRWDIFGDGGPYVRAILQTWKGTKKNQAGRVTTREGFEKLQPFKQLFRNKRAPAMDLFLKIWTGRNYYGGDAWALPDYDSMRREGGRKAEIADWHEKFMESEKTEVAFFISKEVYDRFMPFFIQSAAEAAWFDGWPQALGAGTDEFFSGQALTYEPSTSAELQIVQDVAATQEFDKLWDDLTPSQQAQLHSQIPEMERLEMKKASEKLPPEEISFAKQNRAAKRIFKAMPDAVKKEMNAVGVRISAPSRKIGKFFLNEDRYKAYEGMVRQEVETSLSRRIETPRWESKSEVTRMKIMKDDIKRAKARATSRLLVAINRDKL